MGRLTDGIGTFEMPLSYNLRFNSFLFALSATKLFKSIYKVILGLMNYNEYIFLPCYFDLLISLSCSKGSLNFALGSFFLRI